MGLEDVKSDILNEAEQKSNRIVEEAEEEADEIVEEAKREAERIREEAETEAEEKAESIRKKALSNARMKAKQVKLREKQKHLDQAFEEFREQLDELTAGEREKFVESCYDRANFDVGKVRGSEAFEDAVPDDFEEADIDGIVLVSEDGERRIDFTFDRIVQDYRENHRKDVSEELFQ
jgi:V/A-type H+-transporting ATPase subunit E